MIRLLTCGNLRSPDRNLNRRRRLERGASLSGELLYHWGQRVQVVDEERADAEALAQVGELARQVPDAADEHVRRVQDLLDGQLGARLFTDAVGAAAGLGARMAG